MKIIITSGFGHGRTDISAFDSALYKAGIANYNLIPLSSVIPSNSTVVVSKPTVHHYTATEHGKRLYVVMAREFQNELGLSAYAGLGWVQSTKKTDLNHNGRGLFVEHHGLSKSDVKMKIEHSLEDMVISRYEGKIYGPIKYCINGGALDKEGFACSIVVAVFQAEPWV